MTASITLRRDAAPAIHYEWMTFPQPDGTVTFNITTSSGFGPGTSWTTPEAKLDAPHADTAAVRAELGPQGLGLHRRDERHDRRRGPGRRCQGGLVVKCFHVTTEKGGRYGAAATRKRDALQMVQDRLSREDAEAGEVGCPEAAAHDRPAKAEDMGSWPGAEYGTVLCYVGPSEE